MTVNGKGRKHSNPRLEKPTPSTPKRTRRRKVTLAI